MKWYGRGRGSAEALRFDALVRPHLDRLYRLAYRFTRSPDDAEDLVQDLLVKMLPRTAQLAELDLPGPWLARALYHLFVDQTRQQQRRAAALGVPLDDPSALDDLLDVDGETPDDAVARSRRAEALSSALAALSREHQAVVAWHDIEGYTLEELAIDQGVPIGTLKSRLHRARVRLRTLLSSPDAINSDRTVTPTTNASMTNSGMTNSGMTNSGMTNPGMTNPGNGADGAACGAEHSHRPAAGHTAKGSQPQ